MQIVDKKFIDNLTPVSSSKMRKGAVEIIDKAIKMPIGGNLFISLADWKGKVLYKTPLRAWFNNLLKRVEHGRKPNPLLERLFEGYEYRISTYEEGWVITKLKD